MQNSRDGHYKYFRSILCNWTEHIFSYADATTTIRLEKSKNCDTYVDKKQNNEMKQIAESIGYLAPADDWEERVVLFCLHIDMCFEDLTRAEVEDKEVHK